MIFLKLGGSLITDKTRDNTPRPEVIARLAREVAMVLPALSTPLLIGHGSGSFGHAAARRYGTRAGLRDAESWRGFAAVSVAAARLNRIVADALHEAGIPVFSVLPSASARCQDGALRYLDTRPVRAALRNGIVPLVMGDVALDDARGVTIVSTEEVFAYLVNEFAGDPHLRVTRVLLAGETEGVYAGGDPSQVIPRITPANWETVRAGVGGSRGADVTGGMASKVQDMLRLVSEHPDVTACIFSGLIDRNVARALTGQSIGTLIARE
ncbi:MAG: isopentenyl phosphate kinase [Anaerolineae bacterium]|nr:isopentenyl phosphate kinase [Thermoflexales bacterium]MDW8407472.1 isopentenyl phosphate kinase [Anaerolineae bacterium]